MGPVPVGDQPEGTTGCAPVLLVGAGPCTRTCRSPNSWAGEGTVADGASDLTYSTAAGFLVK